MTPAEFAVSDPRSVGVENAVTDTVVPGFKFVPVSSSEPPTVVVIAMVSPGP